MSTAAPLRRAPASVLFACTTNTVRSPMAAAIMRHLHGQRVYVDSCGVRVGEPDAFTQAIMDPDPRYWDDEFAKTTKYKAIITPPIYVSYLGRRARPGSEDPVTRAFKENPNSDGIGGVRTPDERGGLPDVPTHLKRILNAGNEIEVRQYPKLGDRIIETLRMAREVGGTEVTTVLRELAGIYGHRFSPAPELVAMAERGERFYPERSAPA